MKQDTHLEGNESEAKAANAPTLGVWYNGNDSVVAGSAEEALDVWADAMGEDPDGYTANGWERLPDDKVLTAVIETADDDTRETKTCAEWAKGGKRYLFSEDY